MVFSFLRVAVLFLILQNLKIRRSLKKSNWKSTPGTIFKLAFRSGQTLLKGLNIEALMTTILLNKYKFWVTHASMKMPPLSPSMIFSRMPSMAQLTIPVWLIFFIVSILTFAPITSWSGTLKAARYSISGLTLNSGFSMPMAKYLKSLNSINFSPGNLWKALMKFSQLAWQSTTWFYLPSITHRRSSTWSLTILPTFANPNPPIPPQNHKILNTFWIFLL